MKTKLFTLFIALIYTIQAFAYDAEIDGVYYNFSNDAATVTEGNGYVGNITIPDIVDYNDITYRVTSISERAFYGSNVTSVTIGNNIATIGADVFARCPHLTSLVVEKNNPFYYSQDNCIIYKRVKQIIAGCKNSIIPIDSTVTSIGVSAFAGCYGLTSITIPRNIISVEPSAFNDCVDLKKVNYTGTIKSWCNIDMSGNLLCNGTDLYINDSLIVDVVLDNDWIGAWFQGCTSLRNVTLQSNVSSISWNAFVGCTNLQSVTIKSATPPYMSNTAFPLNTHLIVPCGSSEAYWKDAEWVKYPYYEEAFLFDWSAVSHNEEYGTVLLAQSPTCEDNTATFVAIPASGYKFKTWHDGNTDNPRTVAITNDINYKAHFIDQNDTTDGAITVRFQKPAHWSNVYLYAWNGELPNVINYLGTWPGKQLSQSNEDGWYSYTFDPSLVSVNFIFNSGSVGIQTSDLFTFESVCYIWDDNINDGVQVDCPIIEDVIHVSNVTLNKYFLHLNISQSYQLTATITPSDADNPAISWSSSNPEVATISETGLIETVAQGYTTITVTTADGGFTASCEVYVSVPVESITFDQTALTLVPNKAQQLTATILPENASNKNYTWQSSNENVAIVVKNGLVVALAEGATTITAITEDGAKTATCDVTVTTVSGILLDKTSLELSVGDVAQLTETIIATEASYQLVNWTTSDVSVATVENGLVTAVGAGVAAIGVATVDGGFVATCAVVVKSGETTEVQQVQANPSGVQKVLVDGVLYIVKPNGEKYLVDGRKVE